MAADQGNADAQTRLGNMYFEGLGLPQDYAEAVKWYRMAAEQGYAEAQNVLGDMYVKGYGLPQDYVLSHMWFNLAAAGGATDATSRRDDTAARMTAVQIGEAQKMAREWLAAHTRK